MPILVYYFFFQNISLKWAKNHTGLKITQGFRESVEKKYLRILHDILREKINNIDRKTKNKQTYKKPPRRLRLVFEYINITGNRIYLNTDF